MIGNHNGVLSLFTPDNLTTMRQEPLWYGQHWVQGVGILATAALGYFLDQWWD